MTEHDVLRFLVSLALLLGLARALGELARKVGLPLVFGEICAGIALGPTLLGHLTPTWQVRIFAPGAPATMLGGFVELAVILLLVLAGIEVELDVVRRRGRTALFTSVAGILLPLAGGLVLGFALPDSDLVHPEKRVLFALFLGVALSISALPVIAKTLLDLGIYKTDLGLLVMTAAMINDLVGWLGFSLLVEPMRGGVVDLPHLARSIGLTVAFVALVLLVGRRALDGIFARIEENHHTAPGRVLSVIIVATLVGAICTQALGIHAIFGAFVVGVAAGDSPRLREHTKAVIHEFVTNIFAPVFFASLGLKVDFVSAFDFRICALFVVIATVAKVVGCSLGGRASGLTWREAGAVSFGLNARGAMEIILALLALQAGLIRDTVFVALVIMALATSLMSGPTMKRLLTAPEREEDVDALLRRGAFLPHLEAPTSITAIHELVDALAPQLGDHLERARTNVLERERVAPTGLGDEVAVPHAAVEGLTRPYLAIGLSHGIDFDAPDGRPARIILLLLVPPRAYEREVRILSSIARALLPEASRDALLGARTLEEAVDLLARAAPPPAPPPPLAAAGGSSEV